MKQGKNRNLSPIDYLDVLQTEYFVNLVKSHIYPKAKDRAYYNRVCGYKKAKIEDISERNHLPSVFTDNSIFAEFRSKVIPKNTRPSFIDKEELLLFYYYIGSDVKIIVEDSIVLGKIVNYHVEKDLVEVCKRGVGESQIYKGSSVVRVF